MQPRIELISPKKLVGKHIRTSLSENRTAELWRSLMPLRKHVLHAISTDLISMEIYDKGMSFAHFTPLTLFDKWAAIEVVEYENIPEDLSTFDLPAGLYAVFVHRGQVANFHETVGYIFDTWLPTSTYQLDDRPHFEVMGPRYNPVSADSEEEIYIPISPR